VDYARSEANLEVSRTSLHLTSIALQNPTIVTEERVVDYHTYQVFGIPGEATIYGEGTPSLPQVTRFYRIPESGGVDLVVTNSDYELIDNVDVFPLQTDETNAFSGLRKDQDVYQRDSWFPENIAVISEPMIMRDFRVVKVTLNPVQFNPVTHQARVYHQLAANVVANDQPGINEMTTIPRPTASWAPIYRNAIANLDDRALDDASSAPGTYMIICKPSADINRFVDSLFQWKTRSGYKVLIDSRSNWSSATMQTAITAVYNANNNSDARLQFVCLIGSPSASFGVPTDDGGGYDHTFARCMGSDDLEDIGVGRLTGRSSSDMATINAKLMSYERNPHMETAGGIADTSWFHKGYLLAGVAMSCASNYTLMQWGATQFRNYTDIDSVEVGTVTGSPSGATVGQRFAAGISIFLWRGAWISEVVPGLAQSCNSGWRLPITLCITCTAGDFTGSSAGMAENFLNAGSVSNPMGGVCGIGSTTAGTHNPENITFTGGLMYNLANLGVDQIGLAMSGAKVQLHRAFTNDWSGFAHLFSSYNNLFGEPSMSVWSDVPKVLNVTHPSVLNVGARSVAVTVHRAADDAPVADAVVCLWKRGSDSTWVRGITNAAGQLELPVLVNAPGDMYLTITKKNCKPYLATLPCSQAEWMPMLCSYSIDDDNTGGTQGNGNSIVNPGETIDLPIFVKNFGATVTVNSVRAHMTSDNARVTVQSDTINYPSLAPGDSALGVSAFRIHVAPEMQNGETALLSLDIASSSGTTSGALQIRCQAGAGAYQSHQFTNGTFDPGVTRNLTVTVRNSGLTPMNGVSGHLISNSPFVQVDNATGAYGDIAVNGTAVNTANPFTLSANSMAFRGHQAPMLLVLTASNGFMDSVSFVVNVGNAATTDPTGPDAYGYYAYDNTDVSYEIHPTFNYVNISAGLGQDLNLNDVGEKTAISQIWSTARVLPFGFKFYGHVYDSITVCSNGWMAFGNQAYNDAFRNYPIPAMQAPDAMIAPYWDDLMTDGALGVWMYSEPDSGRVTIQWKAKTRDPSQTSQDFEVILYDTTRYPTFDGNGKILIQYNDVTMNLATPEYDEIPGCTIGIQAPRGLVGLSYAYLNAYSPGAANVVDGRAIVFTTDARMMFGHIQGTVRNSATAQPLPGVAISIDGYGYHTTTDVTGHYLLHNVLIGTYTVRATARRFNSNSQASVLVSLDSTSTVDLSLAHPEMTLSTAAVFDTIGGTPDQVSFNVTNNGNGPLDYSIQVFYAGDENSDPWDSVGGINLTQTSNDYLMMGCEFAYDQWWVTGGGGPNGENRIYRYNINGDLTGSIPQPTTSAMGWFDLAFDGQYLWGSDSHSIYAIDTTGTIRDSIPSPLNPSRAIAYDPSLEHFWVADYRQDIYELDRDGNLFRRIPNTGSTGLAITGLAWNPTDANGYNLYAFSQDGSSSATRVSRFNLNSGISETVADIPSRPGERSGGCAITPGWNSVLLVFAGVLQGSSGDRLGIYEMTFNTTWIGVSPAVSTVQGGTATPVTLSFNPVSLRDTTYRVNLHISSVIFDTTMVLPVSLTVHRGSSIGEQPGDVELPKTYALYQNYPNPFNPETQIRFDLPNASRVKLYVYNSLGQKVATLVDEVRSAGSHLVQWNGQTDNGLQAATGLYFYRMEAGSMVDVKKMLLMH
jgi:hypothetical protein